MIRVGGGSQFVSLYETFDDRKTDRSHIFRITGGCGADIVIDGIGPKRLCVTWLTTAPSAESDEV